MGSSDNASRIMKCCRTRWKFSKILLTLNVVGICGLLGLCHFMSLYNLYRRRGLTNEAGENDGRTIYLASADNLLYVKATLWNEPHDNQFEFVYGFEFWISRNDISPPLAKMS